MSLRSLAKGLLGPLPQWAPVGISPPQQAIQVLLVWGGNAVDVTRNHAVASLQPLTVAIALDDIVRDFTSATLKFIDIAAGRQIGTLGINYVSGKRAAGVEIALFRVVAASQRCLLWPRRSWNAMLQARAIRNYRKPYNFYMPPADVQQLMVFYICPRPVVLVSVSEQSHSNIFPMDLIGPMGKGQFTLALRNTSVSVPTMVSGRRIAISGMPAACKDIVYKLGEHHKKEFVSWDELPLPVTYTEKLKLPAIASALWIRELQVDSSEVIGSHTFFTCQVVSEREISTGLQLHHTAGFHQEYRRRRGMAFVPA